MLESLEHASYPYRVAAGVLFFVVLGLRDWIKHPEDPRRAKEYLFLLFATVLAVVYGVVHDQVTVTLSPEYFLVGKGLSEDPLPLRWATAVLAIRASYGVGLLVGACLLLANNPVPAKRQLSYRELVPLALWPLLGATLGAALGGVLGGLADPAHTAREVRGLMAPERIPWLVAVQGVHTGSYAGGALGALAAIVGVRRRRAPSDACTGTVVAAPPPP